MPWEVLHFFANFVEVIAALAGILVAGLLVTLATLWILPKILGVTPEALEDSEPNEAAIPPPPEDDARTKPPVYRPTRQ